MKTIDEGGVASDGSRRVADSGKCEGEVEFACWVVGEGARRGGLIVPSESAGEFVDEGS